ncbi:fructose-specific PTS transporter subunit EIIC [Acetivibrio sp. MSJd-27]|uniref:PTS fructose transporter subunit IIABC n=1 Tax=Acetivibrio sp. MSJd-27 TaxID=2841523 RepID=UPI001C10C7B6|nr:fructose-specific PTS transporter subunit EIIC [Acetivibrio sp. MSJd-27]MBU5449084.1 fructose-specific PTS transporter subunit EIIC [Acetivibrio sp. MSJd-27]
MKITDLLNKSAMQLNGKASNKMEAIDKLVDLMAAAGNISDKKVYKECILAREKEGTTGIGEGVAIPHAKTDVVKKAGLSVMVLPQGVDFESMDGEPAKLIFMIAAPNTEENIHLDVLGRLSILLMDDNFRRKLISAGSKEQFLSLVDQAEKEKFEEEKKEEKPRDGFRLIAVTACPTGIAHTYMAAENLENTAEEMGISIKVETDGSGGAKNVPTRKQIEEADCIIIAADKNVETARFDGKPVLFAKVADGIHKPKELIQEALSGNVPVYHSGEKQRENAGSHEDKEGAAHKIYKHLMNGVSHMLPFVIGGGILIALAFLFDNYEIDPSNFGSNLPFPAFLKSVGDAAFGFMLPILAGFIAMSIGDRPALAVGFVGGLLAKDGGSGFLGALLAGFIAGYLIVGLRKLCDKLPKSLEGIKPVLIYPLVGILAIGAIITFVVNPPVGAFNNWLTGALNSMGESSKIILGFVLGGMMSIDFGGPLNKAAYVFGTASIATGQLDIMAAVMVGGMVPPIAIALCTTFFKNRFTRKERQSGLTNYIMGLAFITEGAIPFAASDPLRVIPATAIGSAVAGALSMLFGCTLRAPHGGVFVFPVVGNPLWYVVALLAGSVVGMILLALFKKPIQEEQSLS